MADRRRAVPAVEALIGEGEQPLPVIRQHRPAGGQFVAPGLVGAIEAAARGIFPFGLVRPRLAGPGGIALGTAIDDLEDRQSVVSGKSVSVRGDLGGGRINNKKTL